jgi:hypothetical protein
MGLDFSLQLSFLQGEGGQCGSRCEFENLLGYSGSEVGWGLLGERGGGGIGEKG